MLEVITRIDDKTGKPIIEKDPALVGFSYENGYKLLGKDLGREGVKIELVRDYEGGGAIILPPRKAKEFGRWLLQTLGEAKHELPKEFSDILQRLVKQKGAEQTLKRGDKTKIKEALEVLKSTKLRN